MKIAIPVESNSRASFVSRKFARSNFIAVVDQEQNACDIIENPFKDLSMGVGKKLISLLVDTYKIDSLLAFELGLKVQQLATGLDLRLIIINEKKQSLKQLLKHLQVT